MPKPFIVKVKDHESGQVVHKTLEKWVVEELNKELVRSKEEGEVSKKKKDYDEFEGPEEKYDHDEFEVPENRNLIADNTQVFERDRNMSVIVQENDEEINRKVEEKVMSIVNEAVGAFIRGMSSDERYPIFRILRDRAISEILESIIEHVVIEGESKFTISDAELIIIQILDKIVLKSRKKTGYAIEPPPIPDEQECLGKVSSTEKFNRILAEFKKEIKSRITLQQIFPLSAKKSISHLTDIMFWSMTKINHDGTRNLILRGPNIYKGIDRHLKDCDIPKICMFLKKNNNINHLDLSYNSISNEGVACLGQFLTVNRTIKSLNLMCNDFNSEGVKYFLINGDKFKLESLRLNGNDLLSEGGIAIANFIDVNSKIEHLDLGETRQNVKSLVYISHFLKTNKTLKIIDLSRLLGRCGYKAPTDHFAQLIGQMLKENIGLEELHLQKNGITDGDLEIMLNAGMYKNITLKLLDLEANHISDHGVELLSYYLLKNSGIEALMLGSNIISDTGARALAFKLPYTHMKLLDIKKNKIGDEGMHDLLYTLKKPYPMLSFFIHGNPITESTKFLINKLILRGELEADGVDLLIIDQNTHVEAAYNNLVDTYKARYYNTTKYEGRTWLRRNPPPMPISKDTSSFKFHKSMKKSELTTFIPRTGIFPDDYSFLNEKYKKKKEIVSYASESRYVEPTLSSQCGCLY